MRLPRPLPTQLVTLVLAAAMLTAAWSATPALAAVPALSTNTYAEPTNLPRGGEGKILIEVVNLGDAPAEGAITPILLGDKLPAGLTATAISASAASPFIGAKCDLEKLLCESQSDLNPYRAILIEIAVKISTEAPAEVTNEVIVSGGDGRSTTGREALTVGGVPSFGVEKLQLAPTNEDGSVDTQAGSHPFELTSTLEMTDKYGSNPNFPGKSTDIPGGLVKDLHFDLPAGLIGNPQVIPQCTSQEFDAVLPEQFNECPAETAIGVAVTSISGIGGGFTVPLFNLVPSVGEPAKFGFTILHIPIILDTSVRTGGDYGVVVDVHNISNIYRFFGSKVTFWGVPADPRHDALRGWNCIHDDLGEPETFPCVAPEQRKVTPFLTLPTSCSGPAGMRTTVRGDSWEAPGVFKEAEYTLQEGGELLGMDGCNQLPFDPSIDVAPDGPAASTPTGLTVGVGVSQAGTLTPSGLAPADVKDTTVTLPEGVQLSPAGADGLLACSLEEVALEVDSVPTCPEASKVGTVEIKTPLLPQPLEGAAYLAAQTANPFGSLVALYIVAEDPTAGIVVKFAGKVTLNPVTGQIVSTFENTPQLPFEELKLHFFGSARAPLSTPPLCGSYTTQASITPSTDNPPAEPSSTFEITSGPNGAPCADPRPFSPGFEAQSTNIQAGAFTPFTLVMSRPDADQTLAGLSVQLPPGLVGSLSKVTLCPEPQASEGACPESSLIGHTVVSAGLGNAPFTVEGGKVFITGPYKGAPFGLSILNPAKAGPFDLGTVVVRARIEVDPTTAALHIVSDPLPTIKDGIPLQIQHVAVTVDKPEFTFNPTSCNPMKLTGTMTSTEGASASVSTPFQVTNCGSLAFKPGFSASTSGKPSRLNGTSLDVKLTYPNLPAGEQSNIAKVKVELPKQLPSRLTTLQKACTEAVFDANPENCPSASKVGDAVASTPVLAGGLAGPAYFVSHGGAKFPELVVVLKGEDGVTVDLHGETYISPQGITSSTFATVPDVPVGAFELKLPAGPYSALTTNANPCASNLTMPTEFIAQNGARVNQTTPITVTGCKPAIRVLHHTIRGATATITVNVPAAGKLLATATGLTHASATAHAAGNITLHLALSPSERHFLAHHPKRQLRAIIKLRFTPKHGNKLTSNAVLLMR
jgi:hypothetical protein